MMPSLCDLKLIGPQEKIPAFEKREDRGDLIRYDVAEKRVRQPALPTRVLKGLGLREEAVIQGARVLVKARDAATVVHRQAPAGYVLRRNVHCAVGAVGAAAGELCQDAGLCIGSLIAIGGLAYSFLPTIS
jgi:hypothetical protein